MSGVANIVIILAILVIIFAVLSGNFALVEKQAQKNSRIEISMTPTDVKENESVLISVKAFDSKGVKSLSFNSQNQSKTIDCGNQQDCEKTFTETFEESGIYQVKISIINAENETTEKKQDIAVMKVQKCSDGTLFNACAQEKPLYCENGALINKCSKCGCETGKNCSESGECVGEIIAGEFEIASISAEKEFVKPNEVISVKVKLKNTGTEKIESGKIFSLVLKFENAEQFANNYWFELEKDALGGEETELEIGKKNNSSEDFSIPANGMFDLNAALFEGKFTEKTGRETDEMQLGGFITVGNDKIAPSAPTGLNAVFENGLVKLSWNANTETDLYYYKLYQSSTIRPEFISYSFMQSIEKEKNSIELAGLEAGKHYFTLTAVDGFGNESGYSKSVSVEAS